MYQPPQKDFRGLARDYEVVPVYRERQDTETPVSVLQR